MTDEVEAAEDALVLHIRCHIHLILIHLVDFPVPESLLQRLSLIVLLALNNLNSCLLLVDSLLQDVNLRQLSAMNLRSHFIVSNCCVALPLRWLVLAGVLGGRTNVSFLNHRVVKATALQLLVAVQACRRLAELRRQAQGGFFH